MQAKLFLSENQLMNRRITFDIIIITIFIGASSFFAYKYLFKTNTPKKTVSLQETAPEVADEKVINLIRSTTPGDTYDLWYPPRLSNRWKYIEIYQNGMLSGNSQTLQKRITGKNGNADFHFILTNGYGGTDGAVEVGSSWLEQTDSAPSLDSGSIHPKDMNKIHETVSICLIGDFTTQPPSKKQIASLKALLNYLLSETPAKGYNTFLNPASTSINKQAPRYLPLEILLKTRTGE